MAKSGENRPPENLIKAGFIPRSLLRQNRQKLSAEIPRRLRRGWFI
jgi:hypothetical protein